MKYVNQLTEYELKELFTKFVQSHSDLIVKNYFHSTNTERFIYLKGSCNSGANTPLRYSVPIEMAFDDLKDVQLLSYDFYIPDQNILIEYQGVQHYAPVDAFGGKAQFKIQQKHDQLKLEYAKDHGYNLIAVPYTEDTFIKTKKYLIKHGLIS